MHSVWLTRCHSTSKTALSPTLLIHKARNYAALLPWGFYTMLQKDQHKSTSVKAAHKTMIKWTLGSRKNEMLLVVVVVAYFWKIWVEFLIKAKFIDDIRMPSKLFCDSSTTHSFSNFFDNLKRLCCACYSPQIHSVKVPQQWLRNAIFSVLKGKIQ